MDKKNIWIMNHYGTGMFFNKGGRHYSFAKHLISKGYRASIFCASTRHNSREQAITFKGSYAVDYVDGIPFVFIKTSSYRKNGMARIINMFKFFVGLFSAAKEYQRLYGRPDIIIASSVHPLTLVAGIRIAERLKIPCICEIRDLWPESLVEYGSLRKNSLLAKILYQGEKWIYKKASKLIFTMEGGRDYIIDRGWNKEKGGPIDLAKVFHINNGVDLERFNYYKHNFITTDLELEEKEFKVIYAGSLRRVNNVRAIVDTAQLIKEKGYNHIKFLIYGEGTDREKLEKYCLDHKLDNVSFKGWANKDRIPYILSKGDLNILHFEQNSLSRYGASLNKVFEYFASGRPTVSDCEFGYDLIKRYGCGLVAKKGNKEELAELIIRFANMPSEEYSGYCDRALRAAEDYDFKLLTDKLIDLF